MQATWTGKKITGSTKISSLGGCATFPMALMIKSTPSSPSSKASELIQTYFPMQSRLNESNRYRLKQTQKFQHICPACRPVQKHGTCRWHHLQIVQKTSNVSAAKDFLVGVNLVRQIRSSEHKEGDIVWLTWVTVNWEPSLTLSLDPGIGYLNPLPVPGKSWLGGGWEGTHWSKGKYWL